MMGKVVRVTIRPPRVPRDIQGRVKAVVIRMVMVRVKELTMMMVKMVRDTILLPRVPKAQKDILERVKATVMMEKAKDTSQQKSL
jgi:hypothetical protein